MYHTHLFGFSYEELLTSARPLKETAETVKTYALPAQPLPFVLFGPDLNYFALCLTRRSALLPLPHACISIKHALNRFEVYADQVLAVPEAES